MFAIFIFNTKSCLALLKKLIFLNLDLQDTALQIWNLFNFKGWIYKTHKSANGEWRMANGEWQKE